MTDTTYPGVYIQEDSTLSLSVTQGVTAVPAFAYNDSKFSKTLKVNSWLEFISELGAFDSGNILHVAMKSYFENGGGYCYIVPQSTFHENVLARDDVTLLVAAGADINSALIELRRDGNNSFAILDGSDVELTLNETGEANVSAYDSSPHAAQYYPWLTADWAAIDIPPSAAVAGVYCSVDRTRGVWKAPANVVLQGGVKPKYKVTDDVQGKYNTGNAVNMIREFTNGTTVWGARTLEDSDNWRYVPVRRLFSSAENDIKKAMSFAVFEPNSQPTWERVRTAIDHYLYSLWQQGGLAGVKQEEAYFVQIGKGVTMTDDDINQGKMIVKVGMAAVRPAEFIILQFSQSTGQA